MFVKFRSLTLLIVCVGSTFQELNVERQHFVCDSEPDSRRGDEETESGIAVRSFLVKKETHWPNGIVPYTIDPQYSPDQVAMIQSIMKMFSDVSCVRWVPRQDQRDYVAFIRHTQNDVCNSMVGRTGGMQMLNLGDKCFEVNKGYQGAIAHEMMHALGFIHEQQRIDRDCYVQVANKAALERTFDFGIISDTNLEFPYDFVSIMHYGRTNSLKSLNREEIGNFDGEFTDLDKMKLNNMYCKGPSFCQQKRQECSNFEQARKRCTVYS